MKDKILAALKTAFAGVQNDLLDRVAENLAKTVTDETKIQDAITGLNALPISITDYSKMLQTEGDKRVQTAVTTHEQKLRDQYNFTPKTPPATPPPATPPPANETPEQKELRELREWQKRVVSKEQQTTLRGKLLAKLTDSKIPHTFADGVAIEKEEDIDNAFKTVELKFTETKQQLINDNILSEKPAGGVASVAADAVKADIENFASKF